MGNGFSDSREKKRDELKRRREEEIDKETEGKSTSSGSSVDPAGMSRILGCMHRACTLVFTGYLVIDKFFPPWK